MPLLVKCFWLIIFFYHNVFTLCVIYFIFTWCFYLYFSLLLCIYTSIMQYMVVCFFFMFTHNILVGIPKNNFNLNQVLEILFIFFDETNPIWQIVSYFSFTFNVYNLSINKESFYTSNYINKDLSFQFLK